MDRWFESREAYHAAVDAPRRLPSPPVARSLATGKRHWISVVPAGIRGLNGEMLSVEFLPGGLAGHGGQKGNLVAGSLQHETGGVWLLSEGLTRAAARRLAAAEPAPQELAELARLLVELDLHL